MTNNTRETARIDPWFLWALILFGAAALLWSCSGAATITTRAPIDAPLRTIDEALQPSLPKVAFATLFGGPSNYANARPLYAPNGGCTGVTRPHPFLVAGVNAEATPLQVQSGPIAGAEFRVVFWTTCLDPGDDDAAVWLIVGQQPFVPQPMPGWPGCMQMVAADAIVSVPSAAGWQGAIRREPGSRGRIELRWTPGAASIGSKVYLQLLVYKPGISAHGWDLSPGVELLVGDR